LEKVWRFWNETEHIVNWNYASPEWHCPEAENTLTVGGSFKYRMAAKDGKAASDYSGTYLRIEPMRHLAFILDDQRKVSLTFTEQGSQVLLQEEFEIEDENTRAMQKAGWQAILDNFKRYVESH